MHVKTQRKNGELVITLERVLICLSQHKVKFIMALCACSCEENQKLFSFIGISFWNTSDIRE